MLICPNDLVAEMLSDGRLMVRSRSLGIGAKLPPFALGILSCCTQPQNRDSIVQKMGPHASKLFDQLADIGLLIDPNQSTNEVMFSNFAGLNVHRRMLTDTVRLQAYKKAIEQTVRSGDIVIDAGAGSGILALYAARSGAKRVYAIEGSELASELKTTAKNNGLDEIIIPIQGNFGTIELPEKADVLITETFGAWALAEGAAADLKSCIDNNLRPDGHTLPGRIQFWAAPMIAPPKEMLQPFFNRWDNINLSAHATLAKQRSFNKLLNPNALAGTAQHIATLRIDENQIIGELNLEKPCKALALWFDLVFDEDTRLETGPHAPETHWKQTCIAIDLPSGKHSIKGCVNPEDKRGYRLTIAGSERILR